MLQDKSRILRDFFGHGSLRPGQDEVIDRVLAGKNTLAVLPTGGGKSLCYQLPALLLDGLCVVVSPLIALMKDQVASLIERGVMARRIDSSSSAEEREHALGLIQSGELKLLYISPEGLSDPVLHKCLKAHPVSMVAIDEAHCISEWGDSFRPAYIRLPKQVRAMKPGVTLALTATASPDIARSVRKLFGILKRDQVQTSFYRANLSYGVRACKQAEKNSALLGLLSGDHSLPAIVYCLRRGDTEEVAAFLQNNGVAARAYHAGLPTDVRAKIQDAFTDHEFSVICATIAFGMGVDMPDIQTVVHYHPPKSPEGWMQESGRAGRGGQKAGCYMLLNQNDRVALESLIEARVPSERAVHAVLQNIFSQGRTAIISKYHLTTLNDISWELLDVMLARLEKDQRVSTVGGSWMWCRVSPLRWDAAARARILRGFSKKEQAILVGMLDAGERVNLLELAGNDAAKMNRVIRFLRELESSGDVRLTMSHSLVHLRVKQEPEDLSALTEEVFKVIELHKEHDLKRIDSVFDIAQSGRCIAESLVNYFGEKMNQPCGHCSSCKAGKKLLDLPYQEPEDVSSSELASIHEVVSQKRAALSTPMRLARFLCGVYSPAMGRYRLYQHPHWGMLARLPFRDALSIAEAVMGR